MLEIISSGITATSSTDTKEEEKSKNKTVVDLTFSDSDDDEPLAKRRIVNPKPDSTIKFSGRIIFLILDCFIILYSFQTLQVSLRVVINRVLLQLLVLLLCPVLVIPRVLRLLHWIVLHLRHGLLTLIFRINSPLLVCWQPPMVPVRLLLYLVLLQCPSWI